MENNTDHYEDAHSENSATLSNDYLVNLDNELPIEFMDIPDEGLFFAINEPTKPITESLLIRIRDMDAQLIQQNAPKLSQEILKAEHLFWSMNIKDKLAGLLKGPYVPKLSISDERREKIGPKNTLEEEIAIFRAFINNYYEISKGMIPLAKVFNILTEDVLAGCLAIKKKDEYLKYIDEFFIDELEANINTLKDFTILTIINKIESIKDLIDVDAFIEIIAEYIENCEIILETYRSKLGHLKKYERTAIVPEQEVDLIRASLEKIRHLLEINKDGMNTVINIFYAKDYFFLKLFKFYLDAKELGKEGFLIFLKAFDALDQKEKSDVMPIFSDMDITALRYYFLANYLKINETDYLDRVPWIKNYLLELTNNKKRLINAEKIMTEYFLVIDEVKWNVPSRELLKIKDSVNREIFNLKKALLTVNDKLENKLLKKSPSVYTEKSGHDTVFYSVESFEEGMKSNYVNEMLDDLSGEYQNEHQSLQAMRFLDRSTGYELPYDCWNCLHLIEDMIDDLVNNGQKFDFNRFMHLFNGVVYLIEDTNVEFFDQMLDAINQIEELNKRHFIIDSSLLKILKIDFILNYLFVEAEGPIRDSFHRNNADELMQFKDAGLKKMLIHVKNLREIREKYVVELSILTNMVDKMLKKVDSLDTAAVADSGGWVESRIGESADFEKEFYSTLRRHIKLIENGISERFLNEKRSKRTRESREDIKYKPKGEITNTEIDLKKDTLFEEDEPTQHEDLRATKDELPKVGKLTEDEIPIFEKDFEKDNEFFDPKAFMTNFEGDIFDDEVVKTRFLSRKKLILAIITALGLGAFALKKTNEEIDLKSFIKASESQLLKDLGED